MHRKIMLRRGVSALLSAAMLLTACPFAAMAAEGVVTDTATIGGSTAKLVYITMGGNRTAEVALAGGSVHEDAAADTLVSGVKSDNVSVVAAVNGGFFNSYYNAGAARSYPGNCPRIYSTVVRGGKLVNGVGETNLLGVTWDGKPYIDHVKMQCTVKINGRIDLGVWAVNNFDSSAKAVTLFTPEFTLPVKTESGSKVLTLRDGKVASMTDGGGSFDVPAGADLLVYNAGAVADAQQWNQFPAVGDSAVAVTTAASAKRGADLAQWNNMRTVVAGGRMILQNTFDVTSDTAYNQEFDGDSKQSATGVAQRSFAATMSDGRLVFGTANASFQQIAAYLKSAGAVNAVSLDGGASSMLYADGHGYLTTAGRKLASAFVIVDEKVKQEKPALPEVTAPSGSTTGMDANEPSDWAAAPVAEGKSLGILPDWLCYQYRSNITRREFCVLIVTTIQKKTGKEIDAVRLAKGKDYPKQSPFSDTDDWYARECAALGIVTGSDGKFRPDDSLTRQEAAAILQRAAGVLGKTEAAGSGKSFTDAAAIEPYAVEPVAFVTSLGIMNGEGDTFNPLGTFTREQAFITMVNMYQAL